VTTIAVDAIFESEKAVSTCGPEATDEADVFAPTSEDDANGVDVKVDDVVCHPEKEVPV
jgi:hypothetical protein